MTYQVELVDIDALVTGQGRVPGSGLEPEPTLILELLLLCVLAQVDGPLWKKYVTVEITKLRLKKKRPKGILRCRSSFKMDHFYRTKLIMVFKEWDMTIVVNLEICFNYHEAFWPVDPGTCQEGFHRICFVC